MKTILASHSCDDMLMYSSSESKLENVFVDVLSFFWSSSCKCTVNTVPWMLVG